MDLSLAKADLSASFLSGLSARLVSWLVYESSRRSARSTTCLYTAVFCPTSSQTAAPCSTANLARACRCGLRAAVQGRYSSCCVARNSVVLLFLASRHSLSTATTTLLTGERVANRRLGESEETECLATATKDETTSSTLEISL